MKFKLRLSRAHSASRDEGRGVFFDIGGLFGYICVGFVLFLIFLLYGGGK